VDGEIIDHEALRREIRGKYRDVAVDPERSFDFCTGRPLAQRLGYGLARLAIGRSPWLALTGGALALAGWGTLPIWAGQDNLSSILAKMGASPQLAQVWTQFKAPGPAPTCTSSSSATWPARCCWAWPSPGPARSPAGHPS